MMKVIKAQLMRHHSKWTAKIVCRDGTTKETGPWRSVSKMLEAIGPLLEAETDADEALESL